MKTILTLILLFAGLLPIKAQTSPAELHRQDSVAKALFVADRFDDAAEAYQKYAALLQKEKGESDSTHLNSLVMLGKCYFRSKRFSKAIETAQRVADIYGKQVSNKDKRYAWYIDNLALYQASAGKAEEALKNSQTALQIYEPLYVHDRDMATILLHVAENSHVLGDHAAAVKHELRALAIFKELYGEYSDEYIDEAPYLKKYYEANNEQQKADKWVERIEELKKEKDEGVGDLPEPMEFKTVEECRQHAQDALRCCEFYLNHRFTAKDIEAAARYIDSWSRVTDMVHIVFSKNEIKLCNDDKSFPYCISFRAGCSQYAIENGQADFTLDMFIHAMVAVLNHYLNNKDLTGEVSYLEKYVKLYKKDEEKMYDLLKKNFPGTLTTEMTERIKAGETVKVKK